MQIKYNIDDHLLVLYLNTKNIYRKMYLRIIERKMYLCVIEEIKTKMLNTRTTVKFTRILQK